ncbi:MAG TPA: DUF4388 domain-containing protein [Actinobacteria bacterium]|nr:DUF4388 domain-containing protein [Actinomycetota bacterium]
MDALSGDLETFPLDEVLDVVARTRQTGVLRIEAAGRTGRLYFVDGDLVYATTREADGGVSALVGRRERHERRGRQAVAAGIRELVLHQIVEVLLRLERERSGRFWFVEGVTTRAYGDAPVEGFDLVEVRAAADERRAAWRRIRRLLPGERRRFVPVPEIGAAVTLAPRDWEVIVALGEGATAGELAERLGVFEFTAAAWLADLVERGLVVSVEDAARYRDADGIPVVVEVVTPDDPPVG